MRSLYSTLFFFLCLTATAQESTPQILTFDEFLNIVKTQHPVSLQAELKLELGEAILQQSRGAFDPKVQADFNQKYFKDKEYYELGEGKLKVPTWFGVELEGGYERNQGQFLNPENEVPTAGLWFAGISVPIGEGLFIDERRAELQKAKAMLKQTQAERDLVRNELLFSAGVAYWDWFMAFHTLNVYNDAIILAQERYTAVKRNASLGAVPSIDTMEARIQLQNRQLSQQQAALDYQNAERYLIVFLWKDGLTPLELTAETQPEGKDSYLENAALLNLPLSLDSAIKNHPELRKTRAKITQLETDKRWAREQLKPQLNLKYKPLTEAVSGDPFAEYSINNYTWGLQFNFPIFLRKERGKLNQMKIKLSDTKLALTNKQELISFKIQAAINEFETTKNQISVSSRIAKDYAALLDGERRLFSGGESSLFMVNSRERGFITAQIKVIQLISKNRKTIIKTNYALGTLN